MTVKRNTMEYVIEYARKIASEAFPEVLDLEKCSKVECGVITENIVMDIKCISIATMKA